MANCKFLILTVFGLVAACYGQKRFEEIGKSGLLTPPPFESDVVLPPQREPPKITIDCIGGTPCRQTWPKIDYEPSQPNYKPLREEVNSRFRRHISLVTDEKHKDLSNFRYVKALSTAYNIRPRSQTSSNIYDIKRKNSKFLPLKVKAMDEKITNRQELKQSYSNRNVPRRILAKRSPLVREQIRYPVIVPYFCHKMPCTGPMASVPIGKGESSGRYQLPERRRTLN